MTQLPILHIATDHAGLDLSHHFIEHFSGLGYEVHDHGPQSYDPVDDYPAFCIAAAEAVAADSAEGRFALGIVIGGSGNGEQIAANKVTGIRAALAWSEATAKLARQHNDANVVAVGARQHTVDEATQLVEWFVQEPFSGDERHVRRIGQIADYEAQRG
ncbi:ribose-5-phosphate isomerase [Pseudoclavibacter sp. CFCC 14310]|uniref:ribose-5-phosphate isomerase n=1 Tax=Pseudoclavibacter sp. CFCC 14310 TaxID=2615180 RepID=UPI0013017174|nr:ribose-5-phosphate isomerase [Pseudoclavibacter sp. CFCC 14310]KAB1645631.1 ribose-5-phosphate isomerase [Pseudoclavibacter sp. CFCC 14310]